MRFTTLLAAAVLAMAASAASAQMSDDVAFDNTPSGGAMAVDLLLIRPVALVGTVLGLGLFVLQLPLAVVQMELPRQPARKLVVEPMKFTFTRRLGSMEQSQ